MSKLSFFSYKSSFQNLLYIYKTTEEPKLLQNIKKLCLSNKPLTIIGAEGLIRRPVKEVAVYGIDANKKYLDKCRYRNPQLENVLELICCDLSNAYTCLPFSDILI